MDGGKWKGWLTVTVFIVFAEAAAMACYAAANHFIQSKDNAMPFSAGSLLSTFSLLLMLSWKKHPASVRAVYGKVILVSLASMVVGAISGVLGFTVLGFLVGMVSVALALCGLNWLGLALDEAKKNGNLPVS